MTLSERMQVMLQLGEYLNSNDDYLKAVMQRTSLHNPWLTVENQQLTLAVVANQFLQQNQLKKYLSNYKISDNTEPLTVALVMADDVPLAGFYDLLLIFLSGNYAAIKLADNDLYLLPHIVKTLEKINPTTKDYFQITPRLKGFDAIITAAQNKSNRYFETYFSRYPSIIRQPKKSVAILDGTETRRELIALGKDVFSYFGLSDRNVSKLYLPNAYSFNPLLEALHEYRNIILHEKYKNNFDYHFAVYALNREKYLANGCIMLKEHTNIKSPMANLYYEFYSDDEMLKSRLREQAAAIKLVVSKNKFPPFRNVAFGTTQQLTLLECAADVDTMAFLLELK